MAKPNLDLRSSILEAWKILERLTHRGDIPYEAHSDFLRAFTYLTHAAKLVECALPGMEPVKKFQRPTLEEVQLFSMEIGVCGRDANWFWFKCEGNGWKNNGKSIVDWKATIRSWKLAGYLPSQKQQVVNGNQVKTVEKQASIAQREIDKALEQSRRERL